MKNSNKEPLTTGQYAALQAAYDFFNRELFEQSLPQVLITLQRKSGARGYFASKRFTSRRDSDQADELAMNPDHFGRTDLEILSTLVHEMVHVWQYTHGKPGRARYHNREWATKMKEIGLYPSSTGIPGGKETGDRVSHYIIESGAYAKVYAQFAESSFDLHWQSQSRKISVVPNGAYGKAKTASKTRFTCPVCFQNAWGKPDSVLLCGQCYNKSQGEILYMMAELDFENSRDPLYLINSIFKTASSSQVFRGQLPD